MKLSMGEHPRKCLDLHAGLQVSMYSGHDLCHWGWHTDHTDSAFDWLYAISAAS